MPGTVSHTVEIGHVKRAVSALPDSDLKITVYSHTTSR